LLARMGVLFKQPARQASQKTKFTELKKMYVIRENKNGKIFGCEREDRMQSYKDANEKNKDVDLTIYEVVESKNGSLKLEKIT